MLMSMQKKLHHNHMVRNLQTIKTNLLIF